MDQADYDMTLMRLKLVLLGSIALFEDEGMEILRLVNEQNQPSLSDALDAIGGALYWILSIVEETLRQAEQSEG